MSTLQILGIIVVDKEQVFLIYFIKELKHAFVDEFRNTNVSKKDVFNMINMLNVFKCLICI